MSTIEISCSIKYFIQISYSYTSIYTKYNYIYMSAIEISCSNTFIIILFDQNTLNKILFDQNDFHINLIKILIF